MNSDDLALKCHEDYIIAFIYRKCIYKTIAIDGHDFDAIEAAFAHARTVQGKPSAIVIKTIKTAIIPLLPLYIFGIFLNMTYVGQVFAILTVFIKIIGIIFLIHIGKRKS